MNTSTTQVLPDFLIQAHQAEQLTGVHRITLLRWSKRGIAPKPQKICGRWLWRNSEIQELIAGDWSAE